jgi:hypothetical protein
MRKQNLVCCSVEGCGALHAAKGYCATHYQQMRRVQAASCAAEGCGNSANAANGYCMKHYQEMGRNGTLEGSKNLESCAVEGCGNPVRAKGYCGMHYQRMKLKGTLELTSRSLVTMMFGRAGKLEKRWSKSARPTEYQATGSPNC